MIKIIKKGKPKKVKCKNCNTIFQYEEIDVINRGSVKTINCPECKKLICALNGSRYI